jgi:hypothetical protein
MLRVTVVGFESVFCVLTSAKDYVLVLREQMFRLIVQYYHKELYRSPLEFITLFLHFPLISLSVKSGGIRVFFLPFLGAKSVLKHFRNVT